MMKIEDLKDIPEIELKKMVVDLYNSFESDINYYENCIIKNDYDKLLSNVYKTRKERIDNKLNIIRKK